MMVTLYACLIAFSVIVSSIENFLGSIDDRFTSVLP
nr:MAG TPA: hypothetical protein [Caudoviricetes sp.]